MKTLVIASHPYPEQSRAILALQQAAQTLEGVEVRNLESLYGHDPLAINIAAEQAACARADRIVLLFPIHWFNLTPMLKAWQNQVWIYGWAFGPEGTALQGKTLQAVVTAGATEHLYSHEGLIRSTLDEVLTPLKASALYVGMRYAPPLAFLGAIGPSDERLAAIQAELAALLRSRGEAA